MTAEIIQMRDSFPASTFNLEVEQIVLGAAMVQGMDRLGILKPEHFHDALHQRLYRSMCTMYAEGREVSPATLKTYFTNDEAIQQVGGPRYLVGLKTAGMDVQNIEDYARVVIELWQRRQLIGLCNEVSRRTADPFADSSVQGEIDVISAGCADIQSEGPQSRPQRIGVFTSRFMEQVAARVNGDRIPSTGLGALDKRLGGWRKGNQVFIAGRPGMGKTSLGLWLSYYASLRNNMTVAFFSLEMTTDECLTRLACAVASSGDHQIAYEDVLNGTARQDQVARLDATRTKLAGVDLFIDDQAKRSVPSIMAECRNIKREVERKGGFLGLVVIDHLRKVADSGNYKNNANKSEGEKAAMLKDMAKQLGCTVLTLVQLNRNVEGREDKRPSLADMRDSGEIEEEADAVCMIYREAYYKEREKPPRNASEEADWRSEMLEIKSIAEVVVAKNRHGQTGNVKVACDMATNRFWDLEDRL